MYPEYIQGAASASALARELASCLGDRARRARTQAQSARLRAMLAHRGDTEADWLSRMLP